VRSLAGALVSYGKWSVILSPNGVGVGYRARQEPGKEGLPGVWSANRKLARNGLIVRVILKTAAGIDHAGDAGTRRQGKDHTLVDGIAGIMQAID
jgi:hypothetical protein